MGVPHLNLDLFNDEPEFVHFQWKSEVRVLSAILIKLSIPKERERRSIPVDVEEDR